MQTATAQLRGDATLDLIERLVAEYAGAVSAGSVMRCVSRVRRELIAIGVRDNLLVATEQTARYRLAHQTTMRGAG